MAMDLTDWREAAERLKRGEVGVIPTDTLYGIVGLALKPAVVEHIFELRYREADKPFIVLIGGETDLHLFKAKINIRTQELFSKIWPGPVSMIVDVSSPDWRYLHRGLGSLAFRLPAKPELRELLRQVGPLVAPSANLAGEPPATTVEAAYEFFGEEVFYVDGGKLEAAPSALVDGRIDPPRVLRPAPGFRI